jgi:hypothetical protein
VFIGEFGLASNEDEKATREKFEKLLADMESADVDLAAFWVFDCTSQSPKWNVTFDNSRAYMLKLAAKANRRWNNLALGRSTAIESRVTTADSSTHFDFQRTLNHE